MYKGNKKRLMRVISAVTATALVFTAIPAGAKTSKKSVTQIQVTSPYSAKDKKVTTTLTLKKGSTFKIKTSVSPKTADKKLLYKSSKKKVATVSKTGKIKAKKVGKATITIQPKTNKKVKAVIKVTVVKKLKKVTKIKLDQSSLSLTVGGNNRTAQLKASIVSPKKPTNKKFNWFTSNKEIATVNNKGLVTAKKAGQATITVTAADGRGAKAVCKVSVTAGSTVTSASSSAGVSTSDTPNVSTAPSTSEDPGTSSDPNTSQKPDTSNAPSASPSATPLTIVQKSQRTGIKQGETIQLTADGPGVDQVTWTVGEVAGVTISTTGLLQVAADADTTQKIKVTATTSANVTVKTATAEFSIVKNNLTPLTDSQIQLNKESEDHPLGLTYHSPDAYSKVVDPERGEVVKFDSTKGYTSSSGNVLAWMDIDPIYAGKTVSVSAYMKYDANPNIPTNMDLSISRGFGDRNIASQYNAKAGEWYYVRGTYELPNYDSELWDGNNNRLYIRLAQQLTTAQATYYIDGLSFRAEKSTVDQVQLDVAGDVTEIFQNHELQCTAKVSGTENPSQLVDWSIDPSVAGAEISDSGKLKVKNAEAGATINIKATSKEDPTKSATKQVIVRAQTIGSITVSVKGGETEFYPNNEFQFLANVTSAGEPDESVIWSVTPSSDQVGIREDGLLTVGNVAGGTKLTVKATSVFDNTKFGVYEFEVLADTGDAAVDKVTIEGASETIAAGSELSLEAKLETTGNPKKGVIWSLTEPVEGVSLKEETGSSNTLMVEESVARNTSIKVRATSEFNKTKYGEITLTVVDINDTLMEYWEDFDKYKNKPLSDFEESTDKLTWERKDLDEEWEWSFQYYDYQDMMSHGVVDIDKKHTTGLDAYFSDPDDYIQFSIENTSKNDKTYLLSSMISFYEIACDSETQESLSYKLPLKLVRVEQDNTETVLKEMEFSHRCDTRGFYNLEFHEMFCEVQVPAGETLQLRLKLNGELPSCLTPSWHFDGEGKDLPHPVVITLDNVAISSGKKTTINMTTEEGKNTQKFNLEVNDGDTVTYYTNCSLAKDTHEDETTTCKNLGEDTLVATVDKNGMITALHAGETVLVAKITRGDGSVEYKQCIVKVKENSAS